MERKAYQRSEAWQKFEILETVASCPLSIRKACQELGIPRSTYQRWKRGYQAGGLEGLKDIGSVEKVSVYKFLIPKGTGLGFETSPLFILPRLMLRVA